MTRGTARADLARVIWETSRRDEGTISATGANHVADALLREFPPGEPTTLEEALADVHRRYCPPQGRAHDPVCWILQHELNRHHSRMLMRRPDFINRLPEWAQATPGLLAIYLGLWLVSTLLLLIVGT